MNTPDLPFPIRPAPDPLEPDWLPLLSEPFADVWSATPAPTPRAATAAVRGRLAERVAASRAATAAMHTVRAAALPAEPLAPGVSARLLYAAAPGQALRPGEPLRSRLIELQPGARWDGPAVEGHREWLVLRGEARVGADDLRPRDYRVLPAHAAAEAVSSTHGALLFLRESAADGRAAGPAFTLRDAEAGWPDYAPGIRRRVLWTHGDQAALLYHAAPGAVVPLHTHGHDEECLMVQGELFLDDCLLREGDYQLAPAGTGHHVTETDTGVVIYAHGDAELRFVG